MYNKNIILCSDFSIETYLRNKQLVRINLENKALNCSNQEK